MKAWIEMANSYMQRGTLRRAERIVLDLIDHNRSYRASILKIAAKFFKLSGDFETALGL